MLRPDGLLLLADHIAQAAWPVRAARLHAIRRERSTLALIERFAARKPAAD